MTVERYNALARAVVLTLSALLLALALAVVVGAVVGLVDAIAELRDQADQCVPVWPTEPDELSSVSR
jgi:type III secretory pathway component EscS